MDTLKGTDRDPETGAPAAGKAPFPKGGADEGGVKPAQPVAATPQNQTAPGEVRTEERSVDPSVSIESINGEGEARPDRSGRAGGMIGEGGS
jgi:hypothetical protein